MIKYISDLHFFRETATSEDVTKTPFYKVRGFENVIEMNEELINRFNKSISNDDICVILGDFSNGNFEETESILKRLNGEKILILGNYDGIIKDNITLQKYFLKVETYLEIMDGNSKIVCCHYPVLWYDKSKADDYMFYGHIHDIPSDIAIMNNIEKTMRTDSLGAHYSGTFVNCYADFADFYPLTKGEWLEIHNKQTNI